MAVAISDQKRRGAFFTPDAVVQALTCWAAREASDRFLDPSCGDGRFLAAHPHSVGVEQDTKSAQAAIASAPGALVHEGEFFTWASGTAERFECVGGNPPFIRYQSFAGATRALALDYCARHGARFSGLTSSWAPFVVAAATLLKRGGRLAFVVPAEIGHAPYATPLLKWLCEHFARVQVVAVREKLFTDLAEDCWLLYADGYGGATARIRFTAQDRFVWSARPPAAGLDVPLADWAAWNYRLRPFLLSHEVREAYQQAVEHPNSRRLGDFARVGIGYVSGANDFFHLRPSDVKRWAIPASALAPSVRNGRSLPSGSLTPTTIRDWRERDDPFLLLRLRRGDQLAPTVRDYLESDAGQQARLAYKCRTRDPWYAVPDVQVPEYILTYMAGRAASLVLNGAGVTCCNTMHAVRISDPALARRLLPHWGSPMSALSCEIEGHALGGGMLKLEVREAARIVFNGRDGADVRERDIRDAVITLRRWRHYAD